MPTVSRLEGGHRERNSARPAAAAQVLAHRLRLRAVAELQEGGVVEDRGAGLGIGLVLPDVGGEAAELCGQFDIAAGVVDGCLDLGSVADDPRVGQQSLHLLNPELGHRRRVEASEHLAELLPLTKDGEPAEPGLEPLQGELLEQPPVLGDRPAPLGIVVAAVQRVAGTPPAPGDPVVADRDPLGQRARGQVLVAAHGLPPSHVDAARRAWRQP